MEGKQNEGFSNIHPDMTMTDLVQLAAFHLFNNGLDGFDFDVDGESEDGHKMILSFHCAVKMA